MKSESTHERPYLNFAVYRFWDNERPLEEMRSLYLEKAKSLDLKGTVLLSPEGVNAFLSGKDASVRQFQAFMSQDLGFQDLWFKESRSRSCIFRRMLVRIKKEIIPILAIYIWLQQHACSLN